MANNVLQLQSDYNILQTMYLYQETSLHKRFLKRNLAAVGMAQ